MRCRKNTPARLRRAFSGGGTARLGFSRRNRAPALSRNARGSTRCSRRPLPAVCSTSHGPVTADCVNRSGGWPDMVVGHSTGEYSALLAAGVTVAADDAELARNIRRLNALYEQAASEGQIPEAALLTVGGIDAADLAALTREIGAFEIAME